MSNTETEMNSQRACEEEPSFDRLGIPMFDSLKWVATSGPAETMALTYNNARRSNIFMIIFAPIELFLLSIILFVSQLPWPQWCLDIIYKIDAFLVRCLESALKIFEMLIEVTSAFLLQFFKMVEGVFDFFFSFYLFVLYKVYLLASSILNFWVNVFKTVFYPWIKMAEFILSKLKIPHSASPLKEPSEGEETSFPSNTIEEEEEVAEVEVEEEEEELSSRTKRVNINNPKIVTTQSDFESESESSLALGHSDKHGRSYTRLETNMTPEGRLRAEMYKHVKSQLRVMRKGSVKFSRDVASYAKTYIEPKLTPLQDWILQIAKELGLVSIYKMLESEIMSRPYLAKPLKLIFAIILYPFSLLSNITQGEKRSRRSRSSRTESLKRRSAVASPTPAPLGSSALRQSAEPAIQSTTLYNLKLQKSTLLKVAEDEDKNAIERDSALASSEESNVIERDSALASSIEDDLHLDNSTSGDCKNGDEQYLQKKRKTGVNVSFMG